MRKSPRLLAGLVVLGLFAGVGMLTLSAFSTTTSPVSAPRAASENRGDAKVSQWEETGRPTSTVKP